MMVMDGREGIGDMMDGWMGAVNMAFENHFYVHNLCMKYCAHQHAKLPLWPMNMIVIEK